MCRSQYDADCIQKHKKRVKQVKIKHVDAQPIAEVPQREISFSQVIDNARIIHDILLPGITSDIIEDHQFISKQIISEHKTTAHTQYNHQKAKSPHISVLTKSGQLIRCPDP